MSEGRQGVAGLALGQTPGREVGGRAAWASAPAVCFPFVGDFVGGCHISALKLIRAIPADRFRPLVLLHQPDGPLAKLLETEAIPFEAAPVDHVVDGQGGLLGVPILAKAMVGMARYLRRRGVAIVHTNEGRTNATWALPARLAGARLLWHQRTGRSRSLRYLAPLLADRVVAVSRFAAPQPGWFSAADRCTVIHSPFDTLQAASDPTPGRADLLAELGAPPDARILGFFGNLVERKRPRLFVETIAALRARVPDLPIAAPMFGLAKPGDDLGERVAARIEALGLGDRVRLMGFRYPPERWLAACDALLVTAVDEPFGRTLIEAMLLGTPVIAADSGGNPEALRHGETGCLVPPDDPQAFAGATLGLLQDDARAAAIRQAARDDAVARFGIERHAQAILAIYRGMLAR